MYIIYTYVSYKYMLICYLYYTYNIYTLILYITNINHIYVCLCVRVKKKMQVLNKGMLCLLDTYFDMPILVAAKVLALFALLLQKYKY